MSEISMNILPEEMIMKIFHLLPAKDMKNVTLVCKQWLEMGEDPRLWTWALVSVNTREDIKKLNIRRLQLVQSVQVKPCHHERYDYVQCYWKAADLTKLFEVLLEIPTVKIIHGLDCSSLSVLEPRLLTSVFNRLDELVIHSGQAGDNLFKAVAEQTNLKELIVYEATHISPALFAASVSNVEDVIVFDFGISNDQIGALFELIIAEKRPLRKLLLSSCNTRFIVPEVFSSALNSLEEFVTENMGFTIAQVTAVISRIVKGESELRHLMFSDLYYAQPAVLDPDLVRKTRQKIGDFYSEYDTGPWYASGGSEVDTGSDDEETWSDEYEEEVWTYVYEAEVCRLMNIEIVD